MGAIHNFFHTYQISKGSNRLIQAFLGWRVYFPIERIQSLTSAYMEQQGRSFVLHYVDHQLHAKPESGDEHIPL